MTSKTVVILTYSKIASDPRISRHVDALLPEFDVITVGAGPAPKGVVEHHELPPNTLGRRLRLLSTVTLQAAHLTSAARRLRRNEARARSVLRAIDFDVLLCNDAETLVVGLSSAGSRPVVADMHEYAPRHFENSLFWRVVVRPMNLSACRLLPRAAAVTTVSEGLAREYESEYGIQPEVLWNASRWRSPELRPTGSPIRVVHTGASSPHRSLDLLIRAAADLPNVTLDLYLVPSRADSAYTQSLWELAKRTENVRVLDPVGMPEVPSTLEKYDVGFFVLPPVNFNYANALPNKFFDFVQAGLGVVVGPTPEMARLAQEHAFGVVTPDFTVEAAREALAGLTPERVDALKRAAIAASEELSGEHVSAKLRAIMHDALSPPA